MRNRQTAPGHRLRVIVATLAALSLLAFGAAVVKVYWLRAPSRGHLADLSEPGPTPAGGSSAASATNRALPDRSPGRKSDHPMITATPKPKATSAGGHTSTPAPSGSRSGLCAPDPHACGYPDSSNTGVPRGVALRKVPGQVKSGPGWRWNPGGWIDANKPGAVISGVSIDGSISVNAPNVTIKDSYINCTGRCSFNVIVRDTSTGAEANANNTVIENSTITDTSRSSAAGIEAEDVQHTQVLRDNISGEGVGVLFAGGGGLIKDSYIHDLALCCGYHNEDFQSTAGGNVTLDHDTLFNHSQQTADIRIGQDFGSQSNVTVEYNLLAGGGYSVYGGDTGSQERGPATGIKIIGNRLSRLFYRRCGFYGWLIDFNTPRGAGNVASGNYWDGTGRSARA